MSIISLFSRSKNNQPSFELLVAPHVEPLYRLAFRFCGNQHEAEDLVQELLTKLYPRHKELTQLENLRTWLARALHNHFIDTLRRRERSPVEFGYEEDPQTAASDEHCPEHHLATTQLQQDLQDALGELNEDQRTLVIMHDIESYTLAEIADILDTPVGTLKSRLHRSREKLKKVLNDGTFSQRQAC